MQAKLTINCTKRGKSCPLADTLGGLMIDQVWLAADKRTNESPRAAELTIEATFGTEAIIACNEKELVERDALVKNAKNRIIAGKRLQISQAEREKARNELAPAFEAELNKGAKPADQPQTTEKAGLELGRHRLGSDVGSKSLDLNVGPLVDGQSKEILEQSAHRGEENACLRFAEKSKTSVDTQLILEEAHQKGSQGSQQLQGEVLELEFEANLRRFFPQDTIEPVKTGVRGGEVLQRILGEMSRPVGTIFWERKRAQPRGGDWAAKAKQDASEAKADVAIIGCEVLPKGGQNLGLHEGIWLTRQTHTVVLDSALHLGIVTTAESRQSAVGKESKIEGRHAYMTGTECRASLGMWRSQKLRIKLVQASASVLEGVLTGRTGQEMQESPGFESTHEPEGQADE